jgi:flotillin
VALDRMLIEQMPQIVREAAAGLANSRLTILNGSDGLSDMAAGLLAQGIQIFNTVRASVLTQTPPLPQLAPPAEPDAVSPSEPGGGQSAPPPQ